MITLVLALPMAACSGEPSSPSSSTTPAATSSAAATLNWEALGPAGVLPGLPLGREVEVAASPAGFVLLGSGYARVGGLQLYTSADGRTWEPSDPPMFDRDSAVADVTSGQDGVYVLASARGTSSPTVWRHDGQAWGQPVAVTVPGDVFGNTFPRPGNRLVGVAEDWAIAHGPAGILVAGLQSGTLQLWLSSDGQSFTRSETSVGPGTSQQGMSIAPTADGFILATGRQIVIIAADGTAVPAVTGITDDLYESRIAVNGDRLVIQGLKINDREPGQGEGSETLSNKVWCSSGFPGGPQLSLKPATVDPGRLPDLGVASAGSEIPLHLSSAGTGFLMAGGTDVGGLWTSSDGCTWLKQPVEANTFDTVPTLVSVATAGATSVAVGREAVDAGSLELSLWRSGADSGRTGAPTAATTAAAGPTRGAATSGSPRREGNTSVPSTAPAAYRELDPAAPDLPTCPRREQNTEACYYVAPRTPDDVVLVHNDDRGSIVKVVRMQRSGTAWRIGATFAPGNGEPPEWMRDEVYGE